MLIDKLPHNSGHMPLLLISVGVMAGTVCFLTILQAISYYLMTADSQKLRRTPLKMSKECRFKVAYLIDCIAIVFYLTAIAISQILLPIYLSLVIMD